MTTASGMGPAPESALWPIGLITLGVKRTGKRRTGNPFAPFEVAGAGDGLTANLHGHEAGNGGHRQGEPMGHRASPRPYYPLAIRHGAARWRSRSGQVWADDEFRRKPRVPASDPSKDPAAKSEMSP
jgi:hypothetical protein